MGGCHDSHGKNQLIYEESSIIIQFFLGPKVREVFTHIHLARLGGI